jgi:hypothetical protein
MGFIVNVNELNALLRRHIPKKMRTFLIGIESLVGSQSGEERTRLGAAVALFLNYLVSRRNEAILGKIFMSRLVLLAYRKNCNEIAREDLSARYDELLKLRQRVRIAECGRAISHAQFDDSGWSDEVVRRVDNPRSPFAKPRPDNPNLRKPRAMARRSLRRGECH